MIDDKFLVPAFVDELNDGIIHIDKDGKIKIYNEKAKDIFCTERVCGYIHEKGTVKKGDIVILAVNAYKAERNGIEEDELLKLGIKDTKIDDGDAIIVAGVYGEEKEEGIIKISPRDEVTEYVELEDSIKGIGFKTKMDFYNRKISIEVLGNKYEISYVNLFTHSVIIDWEEKKVKFYQKPGYVAWGETNKGILNGVEYREKKEGLNKLEIIDHNILEFHIETEVIKKALECAKNGEISFSKRTCEINDVEVICSVKPVKRNDKLHGAVLIIGDTTKVRKLQVQRDIAFLSLKETKKKLDMSFIDQNMFPKIIGTSAGIMDVKKLAFKASKSQSNVLLLGESGTGKSILARCIHLASLLKNKPFIQVNCNSIPENLLESELFGYVKGAFTGANKSGKKGLFEVADTGTIFLDEIGDLSLSMQVKLLHVIQNKVFYKVGGNEEISVDVRIIVATNRNLETDVKNGDFREDLYYRINVFPIRVLPLRSRKEDIYDLVEMLLPKICARVGSNLKRVSGEAFSKMMSYHWPGNIRELENVLERAVNICDGENILSEDIRVEIKETDDIYLTRNYLKPLKDTVREVEYDAIRNVMQVTKGNKKESMDILGIKKTSFYKKLNEMNYSDKTDK